MTDQTIRNAQRNTTILPGDLQARHAHVTALLRAGDREEAFYAALEVFVKGCNDIKREDYIRDNTPEKLWETIHMEDSGRRRYVRLMVHAPDGTARRVFCFVDKRGGPINKRPHNRGDVLKPATLKGPAPIARGNIFDADFGLKFIGPYGTAYVGFSALGGNGSVLRKRS